MGVGGIPDLLRCCGNCDYIIQSREYQTGLGCFRHNDLFIDVINVCVDWRLNRDIEDGNRIIYGI